MQLARYLSDLPYKSLDRGSVVTIGAYDGIHLGHQTLLSEVLERAQVGDLASVVMSFEPMPREFFSGDSAPARLSRFREKHEALAALGFDLFYCPRFSSAMRDIPAIECHGLRDTCKQYRNARGTRRRRLPSRGCAARPSLPNVWSYYARP